MLLSGLHVKTPMMMVRSIRWYRDLARLGISLPLFVVHDIGHLYASPAEQWSLENPPMLDATGEHTHRSMYHSILHEIAESESCKRARTLKLSDELITVLLARLLSRVARHLLSKAAYPVTIPLEPELCRDITPQLEALFASIPRAFEQNMLDVFARQRLHFLTTADALDLDTLRLLGMLSPEASASGGLAHVDLLAATESIAANDIVNFSLELLPSVLETPRNKSAGTQAIHGYSGLGTKGSFDSMVLTELTWDDFEFNRRYIENEILYYTREQAQDEAKRLHYLVIDASASMRGDREVFARGVAIALIKKLQLQGEDVWLRFFDSRLYDTHKTKAGAIPAAQLLGFKGERGRNPSRVFAQLATELALVRQREHRDPVVHLITHAALHVPRNLVGDVAEQAHLFGIFIVPSGGALELEYLDLLKGHVVVSHETLSQSNKRKEAGQKIVSDAANVAKSATSRSTGPNRPETDEGVPPSLRGRSIPPPSLR
jgi:hypothetical protein